MGNLSEKIFKNTLFNTIGSIFTTGMQIVIIPYIILKLGMEQFGIWALVSIIFGIFTALDFGTGTAFVKYFSEYHAKKEHENFNRVMVTGLFFMVTFSLILISIVIMLKNELVDFFNIPIHLKNESVFVFMAAAIIFGYTNIFGIFQAILKGLQRMDVTNTINIVCSSIYIIGVFAVLNLGFGLKGLIINQGIRFILISFASMYYSKKIFKKLKFRIDDFHFTQLKEVLSYGIKMQISSIANLVNLQIDKTIIGYFLNLTLVAAYEIGQKISLFNRMIVGLALSALVPAVSELDAVGRRKTILKLYERGNKYIASFTFPILIFTITFADLLIHLWMGTGFERSILVARLLVSAVFVNMFTGVGVMIVRGIGKPSYEAEYAAICLILNVVLGIILVQSYGFLGVVLATPISVIIGSIYFILKFHWLFRNSFLGFARRIYLLPFLISIFLAIFLFTLNAFYYKNYLVDTRIEFLILILINSVIFFPTFVWLLKKFGFWDEEDKIHLVASANQYPILGKIIAYSIG